MSLRSLALAALGILALAGAAAPAHADWGDMRRHEAQERAWRIQQERAHAWRQHQQRAQAWRQYHRPYAPPRPYAYAPGYRPYGPGYRPY